MPMRVFLASARRERSEATAGSALMPAPRRGSAPPAGGRAGTRGTAGWPGRGRSRGERRDGRREGVAAAELAADLALLARVEPAERDEADEVVAHRLEGGRLVER